MNADAAAVTVTLEVEPSPATPATPAVPRVPLPYTGADVDVLILIALALLLAGLAALLLVRTRLETTDA